MNFRNVARLVCLSLVLLLQAATVLAVPESNDDLVEEVVNLYTPGAPVSTHSGTSLIKAVEQRWESLDEASQRKLIHFIQEPVTDGPGAPEGQKVIETEHFKVFFVEQGEDAPPGGEAYAQEVASYLEAAWAKEVEECGFAAPPGSEGGVKCHIKNINHNGLTHAATGKTAWIEMNSDIVAYTKRILGDAGTENIVADPQGVQAGMLKACCAHEFFHCIQAAYDWDEANWWCEGTAEWMGDTVFPESKFYCNNVRPRFEEPHVSLFSKKGWFEYATSIWAFYIAENFGGAETIKSIWEGCKGKKKTVIKATEAVLGDLQEQFLYYACYNYLRAYADGERFPEMATTEVSSLPASIEASSIQAAENFGANYFTVAVPEGLEQVTVRVKMATGNKGGARIIEIRGGRWKILPQALERGKLELGIAVNGDLETVIVVVGGFQSTGAVNYTLTVE